tara:strand:- start:1388 stop:2398 length:1011 start_codon:yes stop_codon:yes gene_type:complete
MKNEISFVVIGFGHIGKRHAEMILKNPSSNVVAVVDVKDKENLNTKLNVPFFRNLKDLFESEIDFDIATIATPNGLHCQHALQILNFYKHVIIEKPMALTASDAELIIHKALEVHKHVFTVMQNRYSPPSKWIKGLVEEKLFGDIYFVQLNCYWNRDDRYYTKNSWHGSKKLDGGTLFTQFSHFIDLMYWLFGDIIEINSNFYDFNHSNLTDFEDSGFVNFKFKSGPVGLLNFSTSVCHKNFESSMTIISENGTVKIGGQYMDKVEYCDLENYVMPILEKTNPGNDYGTYKGSAQNHGYVIENVISVLNNNGKIDTNALEGLKVVDIIERIYKSRK